MLEINTLQQDKLLDERIGVFAHKFYQYAKNIIYAGCPVANANISIDNIKQISFACLNSNIVFEYNIAIINECCFIFGAKIDTVPYQILLKNSTIGEDDKVKIFVRMASGNLRLTQN
ncbi:MAG TPA: hypothetical protein PKZ97_01945 [Azospirillaceae bacterium]|nr:hypothetical protein [Azospirillaceae bacterium]HRQ79858.1 hypothetical protein [Azospirillaceae bacterium]